MNSFENQLNSYNSILFYWSASSRAQRSVTKLAENNDRNYM